MSLVYVGSSSFTVLTLLKDNVNGGINNNTHTTHYNYWWYSAHDTKLEPKDVDMSSRALQSLIVTLSITKVNKPHFLCSTREKKNIIRW